MAPLWAPGRRAAPAGPTAEYNSSVPRSSPAPAPGEQLSVRYDVDGTATFPSLSSGQQHFFAVTVQDAAGNTAQTLVTYTPP